MVLSCPNSFNSFILLQVARKEEKLGAHEANFPHNEPNGQQLNDDYLSFKFVRCKHPRKYILTK